MPAEGQNLKPGNPKPLQETQIFEKGILRRLARTAEAVRAGKALNRPEAPNPPHRGVGRISEAAGHERRVPREALQLRRPGVVL